MLLRLALVFALAFAALAPAAFAQTPPSVAELGAYRGLHAAAARGDSAQIMILGKQDADLNRRDANGRTPLHVATFMRQPEAITALLAAGADPALLDGQRYDAVTIAAVQDDLASLSALLAGGASAKLVTSRWNGTALIAAAHLGHDSVVKALVRAGAPVDFVNNLGWTALLEAVILGDGGPRHVETARALIAGGADPHLADRDGATALDHAKRRDYAAMAAVLRVK